MDFTLNVNAPRLFTLIYTFFLLFITACSQEEKRELSYVLPEGWEVLQDKHVNAFHRKIQLVTPFASFVELELLKGEDAFTIDSREYFKRYLDAALPTDELKQNAKFDVGEVERVGQKGYFTNVTITEPQDLRYTLELFQFAGDKRNLFVVINTPFETDTSVNISIDAFLKSIQV